MKKSIVLLLLFLIVSSFVFAQDITISGINEATYVYKSAEDSLKNYFDDKLTVQVDYDKISLGLKYRGYLPKFDDQKPIDELSPNDISHEWAERYVTYSGDNVTFHVGNMEESFGEGIFFRTYEDENLNIDKRLDGFMSKYENELGSIDASYSVKALYGILESEFAETNPEFEDKNDSFYGTEISFNKDFLDIGASVSGYRELYTLTDYANRKLYTSKVGLSFDMWDFYGEYAYTENDKASLHDISYGNGVYATSNLYFGDFTLTGSYKYFDNFNYRLADIPTLNHADEDLDNYIQVGLDEEGALGEVSWDNDNFGKVLVSYAEAWSRDYNYRLCNGYYEYAKTIGENTFIFSFENLERVNNASQVWDKEFTPQVTCDIPLTEELGFFMKLHYVMNEETHGSVEHEYIEPMIQTDFSYKDYAISLILDTTMDEFMGDDCEYWLGGEFKAQLTNDTGVIIFAGKQKGGMVCRNGACKEVQPFEGVKIELNTRF